MAVTAISTMYPPKIPTFAPAFLKTDSPRVYYEVSQYMSPGDARRLHVSIVNQDTNDNSLDEATGIYITEGLEYDEDRGSYFVTIPMEKILNSTGDVGWLTNCYYKLQLRFDSYDGGTINNNSDYFISHTENFSEWSTVCLLRAIEEPELLLTNFDNVELDGKERTFNRGIVPISGQLFFGDEVVPTENDQVQSFRVLLIPRDKTYPIYRDSGEIYTGNQVNPNTLNYNLDLAGLQTDQVNKFRIRIYYLTRNQFQSYKDYYIQIAEFVVDDSFNPEITIDLNDETGSVAVKIKNWMSVFGKMYVRRSSSLSEFKEWEMIREEIVAGPIDETIYDTTIQSGVWYRYIVQYENIRGGITPIFYSAKFVPNFFGPFLSRGDKQIHLQYNYTISNMKPVVNRQKIDTIGGKYPKFAENAAMNYKQFNISGLLSTQEDEFHTFLKDTEFFKEEYGNYGVYKEENDIIPDYDQLWEREWREELIKWLNDGEPKLYRSQPEGNVVVMLSDVTLTPIAQLSRRLWNFSATMTEVEDAHSLETLDRLGIYDCVTMEDQHRIGVGPGSEEEPIPDYVDVVRIGQIDQQRVGDMVTGKVDLIANYIMPNLQARYAGILSKRYPEDGYLKNVKIQFHSKPHIFLQKTPTSPLLLVDDPNSYSADDKKKFMLGYCFEVNNPGDPKGSTMFFVNSKGYFQIPYIIDVTSLYFPQEDDVVSLDYLLCYKEKNDSSTIITGSSIEKTLVAQYHINFVCDKWYGSMVRRRHTYLVQGRFYQRMEWWKGISIDCAPYAVFEIIYEGGVLGQQVQAEAGFSGVVNLLKTVPALDFRFVGRRMHKVTADRLKFAEDWEYIDDDSGTSYNSTKEIEDPVPHVVYNVNGKKYLYYTNFKFYEVVTEPNGLILAKVPVDGLLNYYGSVIRDSYV